MADGPHLTIDIAQKRFPVLPVPLLADFHLDIPSGEVMALVGPSGVGKSTLLRLIAGIDTDFDGRITIDGVEASAAPPAGFVFQDSRLLPWLSAIDNIRAVSDEISESQARELLGRVGLSGYETAYPAQLSGGMQRRVALARAFSVNPRLLLLDEPFVSLDAHLVAGVQRVFLDLVRDTHATAILVTHLPEDAARMADRAVVLARMPAHIVADMALLPARDLRNDADLARLSAAIINSASEARV